MIGSGGGGGDVKFSEPFCVAKNTNSIKVEWRAPATPVGNWVLITSRPVKYYDKPDEWRHSQGENEEFVPGEEKYVSVGIEGNIYRSGQALELIPVFVFSDSWTTDHHARYVITGINVGDPVNSIQYDFRGYSSYRTVQLDQMAQFMYLGE
jgi:hypothetical protein